MKVLKCFPAMLLIYVGHLTGATITTSDMGTMSDYDLSGGGTVAEDSSFGFNSVLSTVRSLSVQFQVANLLPSATVQGLTVNFSGFNPSTGTNIMETVASCGTGMVMLKVGINVLTCSNLNYQMKSNTSFSVGFSGSGHFTIGNQNGRPNESLTFSDAPVGVPEPISATLVASALMMFFVYKKLRRRCL